jgi:hypothetical protein
MIMSFVFKVNSEVSFKNISTEYVAEYLKPLKDIGSRFEHTIAITLDINMLTNSESEILLDNGQFTPEYYLYWTKLIFEINKICSKEGYGAYWIDRPNKKYYDETVATCLQLMTDSLRWENNNPNLFYAWGNINQSTIFKEPLSCAGIIMPCIEGWGVIALLNNEDYQTLKLFFE